MVSREGHSIHDDRYRSIDPIVIRAWRFTDSSNQHISAGCATRPVRNLNARHALGYLRQIARVVTLDILRCHYRNRDRSVDYPLFPLPGCDRHFLDDLSGCSGRLLGEGLANRQKRHASQNGRIDPCHTAFKKLLHTTPLDVLTPAV